MSFIYTGKYYVYCSLPPCHLFAFLLLTRQDYVHKTADNWVEIRVVCVVQLQQDTKHSYAILMFYCLLPATVALAVMYHVKLGGEPGGDLQESG